MNYIKMMLTGLLLTNTVAFAQPLEGFVTDSRGGAIKTPWELCVRTGTYDKDTAYNPDCNPKVSENVVVVSENKSEVINVFFAFNSAILSEDAKAKIKTAFEGIENPKNIDIYAATDFLGTEKYNQKLGQERLDAVYKYVLENVKNKDIPIQGSNLGKSYAQRQNSPECKDLKGASLIKCIQVDRLGQIHVNY